MSKYWMITNRASDETGTGLGKTRADKLRFYTLSAAKAAKPDKGRSLKAWTEHSAHDFRKALEAASDRFPLFNEEHHERQKHVTLFVHGYNNTWLESYDRYKQITDDLYGDDKLGICVLFTWPSDGQTTRYLADRADARASGQDLAKVLNTFYEHGMLMQQKAAAGQGLCKAKVSVLAHSMGNWVLQNALYYTWERQNRPLLVSLVNQCIMVAADVDNDLFSSGESIGNGTGEGMANLCYRITALYSGRDAVLGVSAGLKHFGKRRLGRSGFDPNADLPDNAWQIDCSPHFAKDEANVHSAYFWTRRIQKIIRLTLQGYDRQIVEAETGPGTR